VQPLYSEGQPDFADKRDARADMRASGFLCLGGAGLNAARIEADAKASVIARHTMLDVRFLTAEPRPNGIDMVLIVAGDRNLRFDSHGHLAKEEPSAPANFPAPQPFLPFGVVLTQVGRRSPKP
jgi:hypothetical protein